jgi:hypothetical protein
MLRNAAHSHELRRILWCDLINGKTTNFYDFDNIKMGMKETGSEGVERIHLGPMAGPVNTVMKLWDS